MGIVDRVNAIDVTDWDKTDPDGKLPPEYKEAGLTLNTIYINGRRFDGISRDSSLGWEEFVWSEEPTRSKAFAFTNMDDIDVGLVAQCQVNFKYFNIDDFINFREAIKQRYFLCTFFNVDTCQWEVNREMYCSKSQRDKLYYFNPKLVGVLDFNISLVATNRDRETHPDITVFYNANGGTGTLIQDYKDGIKYENKHTGIKFGNQYKTNNGFGFTKTGYALKSWNTEPDGSGWTYFPTQSFTAFKDLTLYAIWG